MSIKMAENYALLHSIEEGYQYKLGAEYKLDVCQVRHILHGNPQTVVIFRSIGLVSQ